MTRKQAWHISDSDCPVISLFRRRCGISQDFPNPEEPPILIPTRPDFEDRFESPEPTFGQKLIRRYPV